jgi:hypothetical protein
VSEPVASTLDDAAPAPMAARPRERAALRSEAIRWRDSGMQLASDEWTSLTALRARSVASALEVTTVGLLVHEDDEVVVLGLSVDTPGDAVFGAQLIWKSAIIERRDLDGQGHLVQVSR